MVRQWRSHIRVVAATVLGRTSCRGRDGVRRAPIISAHAPRESARPGSHARGRHRTGTGHNRGHRPGRGVGGPVCRAVHRDRRAGRRRAARGLLVPGARPRCGRPGRAPARPPPRPLHLPRPADAAGRRADRLLAGRAHRVLPGRTGADLPRAPRHPVRQLDLPCRRFPALPRPGPLRRRMGPTPVSLGESWHDLHRVGPTGARHDVRRPDRRRITARRGEAPEGVRHEDGGPQE
ncbi:hypothetical protein J2Z21_002952 [Streptomyces griseochromogenes]|uniref:Uncharacterized protein n=1 Tax=Streptomyces griseochromogenes TaxID=68214 RepID=A0ABS4LRI3_9ACTN|nr:hypothetical protein [Streptomyces griseochromogenes]